MENADITFPTDDFKDYMEFIYSYCVERGFSLILKGSLANGTAKQNSDIDLIVLGAITNEDIDNIISQYNTPVMTNYTENPKGIFIIVYKNGICVDLDLRDRITTEDLKDAFVLDRNNSNFIVGNEVIRKTDVVSKFLPNRPEWYKTLRLIHRGTIKFLCDKKDVAWELLTEVKDSLNSIGVRQDNYKGCFKEDMTEIFNCICDKYDVEYEIKVLFQGLFNQLSEG